MTLVALLRAACRLELMALKPGNVHRHADGHALSMAQFMASADAMACGLTSDAPVAGGNEGPAMLTLGARILAGVQATRRVVDTNTNLGIILLTAPMVQAASRLVGVSGTAGADDRVLDRAAFDDALDDVLRRADLDDAVLAYRAIRLAEPGGLGHRDAQDVSGEPTVTLCEAMRMAAGHDRIARAWTDGMDEIRHGGRAVWQRALDARALMPAASKQADAVWPVVNVYLHLLSAGPDTLVQRRHGSDVAMALMAQALVWNARVTAAIDDGGALARLVPGLLEWDAQLKRDRINPGTCADLTVATLVHAGLTDAASRREVLLADAPMDIGARR